MPHEQEKEPFVSIEKQRPSLLSILASSKRMRSLTAFLLLAAGACGKKDETVHHIPNRPTAETKQPELPGHPHSGTQEIMHAHTHDEHDLDAIRESLWSAEEAAYLYALQLAEKPQNAVYSSMELAEAFRADVVVYIGCMDERVTLPGMKKIGIGGSCVLFTDAQLDQFVANLRKKGITVALVTDHDGCGACALYCTQKKMDAAEVPKVAHETAARVGRKLGLPEEKIQNVGFDRMTGNPHLHHARGIVVDCSGRFCPEALNARATKPEERKFPASFELTAAAYPDLEQLEAELEVALSIAEGDHGMGEKMFSGEKLLLTFVEDPSDPVLTRSVRGMIDVVHKRHQKTVRLVVLKAPAPVIEKERSTKP